MNWRLPIYEVSPASGGYYRVQTSATAATVGTFCYAKAHDEESRRLLSALKTGDFINCKGRINGVSFRNIEIKPAIVTRP